MKRELVMDETVLSQRCALATAEDAAVAQDLIDTLESLEDCACLAANQIGVTKAVVVWMDADRTPHVMYNPKLLFGVGAQRTVEGCLTREEPSKVRRFGKIKVNYDELVDGELKHRKRDFLGWEAQMIQHMIDHCNGKLV
ncbi:MAG: peptide deformylase [Coriobacteriales bacterium]|nr:peptide deformylase [Coriobacteriales bacterium]